MMEANRRSFFKKAVPFLALVFVAPLAFVKDATPKTLPKRNTKDEESLCCVNLREAYCAVRHDKTNYRFVVQYSPTIKNLREVIHDKHETIYDANIGTICDFISEEIRENLK